MKTIGAFEAKTNFSKLLKETEDGEIYVIERRGRAVARLTGIGMKEQRKKIGYEMLERIRHQRSKTSITLAEINEFKSEGRH